jgi:hypothetical protein
LRELDDHVQTLLSCNTAIFKSVRHVPGLYQLCTPPPRPSVLANKELTSAIRAESLNPKNLYISYWEQRGGE